MIAIAESVIFGVTSSPAGLTSTTRKHAENYCFDEKFVQEIVDSFMVDDYIGGTDTLDKAVELFKKLKLRFMEAHFFLRKWRTNNTQLRTLINDLLKTQQKDTIPFESKGEINSKREIDTEEEQKQFNEKGISDTKAVKKTLGVIWDEEKDNFVYDFHDIVEIAKRTPSNENNFFENRIVVL